MRIDSHLIKWVLLAAGILETISSVAAACDCDSDSQLLLAGVKEVATPGVAGGLALLRENAIALAAGRYQDFLVPVIAASRWGRGRVVAFGHDGYFRTEALKKADTGRLMLNAVAWCGNGPVGVYSRHKMLYAFFQSQGIACTLFRKEDLPQVLSRCGVLCFQPSDIDEHLIPQLKGFIQDGGGVILAETGWGWLQLNPGKTLHVSVGNRLLYEAGILWTDLTVAPTSPQGFWAGGEVLQAWFLDEDWRFVANDLFQRARDPLAQRAGNSSARGNLLEKGRQRLEAKGTAQALQMVRAACRAMPLENEKFWQAMKTLAFAERQPVPTANRPITLQMPKERLQLIVFWETLPWLAPEEVPVHPAASDFPGLVPAKVPRVSQVVDVDAGQIGWHSTGYYAPPGELITIRLKEDVKPHHLGLRIGSHSDSLWHANEWRRAPEIVVRIPIDQRVIQAASPFGGLVYVEVLRPIPGFAAQLELSGGVVSPYFVAGKTSAAEWENLRRLEVPWGELESSNIILTLPSSVLRQVDRPDEVLAFWDRVLDACADLAGWIAPRQRPERIVTDRQISAGYMHAGYPIMTHLDVAELIVGPNQRHADPRWGLFHELGHNHQSPAWTFPEVTEVTCNLFTIYILETVCGMKDREAMHPGLKNRQKRIASYFGSGVGLAQLGKDPFLALIPYLQLQEAFGWEAFKRVFSDYIVNPPQPFPTTPEQKIDEWVIRFSRVVERNLAPFHRQWGFPVSQSAEDQVGHYPVWMPPELPGDGI